jgi:hypothetical protein
MVPPETDLTLAVMPVLGVPVILPNVAAPAPSAPAFEAH